ncbi:hypothetical protein N0V82_001515 [Gnomoniopsis sp. IMI 355080]|nr:hypothetical protein N0V82_001515 [Gnomoniopsis sp. IMI 355080]
MAPKSPPGFTNDPQSDSQPSLPPNTNTFPSASTPTSSTSSAADPDPPPPLPTDLNTPADAAEDAALEAWVLRNAQYFTNIRWHHYRRLPALSSLWGYSEHDFRAECLESLVFYSRAAGRKLTEGERDAVLSPIATTCVAATYDRPVALGLAIWGMARSWSKSGQREMMRRNAATAAANTTPGVGTIGADGHITHFATPQGQQLGGFARPGPATRSAMIGSLFRRIARTSLVGLSCMVGYYALWTPWRVLLSKHEVETIRNDFRCNKLLNDMDQNMKDKRPDLTRSHGEY